MAQFLYKDKIIGYCEVVKILSQDAQIPEDMRKLYKQIETEVGYLEPKGEIVAIHDRGIGQFYHPDVILNIITEEKKEKAASIAKQISALTVKHVIDGSLRMQGDAEHLINPFLEEFKKDVSMPTSRYRDGMELALQQQREYGAKFEYKEVPTGADCPCVVTRNLQSKCKER